MTYSDLSKEKVFTSYIELENDHQRSRRSSVSTSPTTTQNLSAYSRAALYSEDSNLTKNSRAFGDASCGEKEDENSHPPQQLHQFTVKLDPLA